jgi:hypothetical protein
MVMSNSKFEKFAKNRGLNTEKLCHGDYKLFVTGEAYAAWQAASAQDGEEAVGEVSSLIYGDWNSGDGTFKNVILVDRSLPLGTKVYTAPKQTSTVVLSGVWQFYQDGEWNTGMNTLNHRANTEAEFIVRDLWVKQEKY